MSIRWKLDVKSLRHNKFSSLPTSPKKDQGSFSSLGYNNNTTATAAVGTTGFRKEDSFQNFQLKTQDAWDIGDDEEVLTAPVNPKVVQSTALQVGDLLGLCVSVVEVFVCGFFFFKVKIERDVQ